MSRLSDAVWTGGAGRCPGGEPGRDLEGRGWATRRHRGRSLRLPVTRYGQGLLVTLERWSCPLWASAIDDGPAHYRKMALPIIYLPTSDVAASMLTWPPACRYPLGASLLVPRTPPRRPWWRAPGACWCHQPRALVPRAPAGVAAPCLIKNGAALFEPYPVLLWVCILTACTAC